MRRLVLCLVACVLGTAALGCKTHEQKERAWHAKVDPRVDELIARTDKALAQDMPPYRSIADEHAKWAAYLSRLAVSFPSFKPKVALLHRRNADIYDLLEEPATADKYRALAVQYEGGDAGGAGGEAPTVSASVAPDAGAGDLDPDAELPPPAAPEVRARVAVLPLDEPKATKDNYGYGEQYSGFLHTAFDRSTHFELIERSAIRQIMAERNLAEMQVEGDAAKELGKLLQVDILCVGFIGPNPDHSVFNVTARLVSTATGKSVVSTADTIKEGNAGFQGSCRKVAGELTSLYAQRRN